MSRTITGRYAATLAGAAILLAGTSLAARADAFPPPPAAAPGVAMSVYASGFLDPRGLAFNGPRLYALLAGGGCTHGHPSEPSGVYRVSRDGTIQPIVGLSDVLRAGVDSKDPASPDFEADGAWWGLIRAYGAFYVTEPNHGLLMRVDEHGNVARVADLLGAVKAQDGDGDYTYTAITRHRGSFYIGTLGRIGTGFAASVYRVAKDGSSVTRVATGLRGLLGVAFDTLGRMLVLQTTDPSLNPELPPLADPAAGKLLRIERDGSVTTLVSGLAFPTALIAGSDGAFYVSNCGYHCDNRDPDAGPVGASLRAGQVLRIAVAGSRADTAD